MAEKKTVPYEESELYRIRHSTSHIMAQAVAEMFEPGEAKLAIGPPIADGFYYDFELPRQISSDDFAAIEKRMRQIMAAKHEFVRQVISAEKAKEVFKDQPYKLELIEGLEAGGVDEYGQPTEEPPEISFYTHDDFTDLCRGPHVENTGKVNPSAFKLMSVAGAYWRGDEKNKMLQRIYGTAWSEKKHLKEHLFKLEEAKKRDHRRIGKEMDLFSIQEEAGPGLIFWHPKGGRIRTLIEDWLRTELLARGYDIVFTPHVMKRELWRTSGHADFYSENMFSPIKID
ncbi:MAG: threonine--tRNA ligase, partial [Chloroflexi bacterium]|nr:threonine--tRNA ligase [Chloroflexota bacterium]